MILNLINLEVSQIKYNLTRFPDKEPQFIFTEELDRKEPMSVKCRITSAEELFILLQVGDILDRHEIEWELYITYLMSMRMDRVMDFNRPFSLKIVCNMLNTMNYKAIHVLEAHSRRTASLLGDRFCSWEFDYSPYIPEQSNLVFPDKGAMDRLGFYSLSRGYLVFDKSRDPETGRILSFDISKTKNCYYSTFVFIDDLCDAGGTFLGELEVLKKIYPNYKFIIVVCHAVNMDGLVGLCNHFDEVIVSNSYTDVSKYITRDNLKVVDVCQ